MAELIQKQDTLNQGREKINAAITDAETAKNISEQADDKATQALAQSESTQTQLDTIVIEGDSSVEAAQARVPIEGEAYPTLKARLDAENAEVTAQLAQKVSQTDFEKSNENIFYKEVFYEKHRDQIAETDYYIVYIPNKDEEGNLIKLEHGFSNDDVLDLSGETVRDFSERNLTTVAINASIFNSSTNELRGIQIKDGIIVKSDPYRDYHTLGIKVDNTLVSYPPSISAESILADGSINALTGFYPLIQNGSPIQNPYSTDESHPRQIIAQKENKDILILTVDGRLSRNNGFKWDDCIRVLLQHDVTFAYMLDGGGSVTTTFKGGSHILNKISDGNGFVERRVSDFLYIKKQSQNTERVLEDSKSFAVLDRKINDLETEIKYLREFYLSIKLMGIGGDVNGIESFENNVRKNKLFLRENRIDYFNDTLGETIIRITSGYELNNSGIKTPDGYLGGFFRYAKTVTNVNEINNSGIYWSTGSATGAPNTENSWAYIQIQQSADSGIQIAFPYSTGSNASITWRRTVSGGWGNWKQ